MGTFSNIDPDKVYDYHKAFEIAPTEVKYNVDVNMNQKSIKNIRLDPNDPTSVATMGQITGMAKFTINNLYRTYFEEVFDFTDASNYGLITGASGVVFDSLISISGDSAKNISFFPSRKTIDKIRKEGLNVDNYYITFRPTAGITKYTLCIVFYHWRNRTFYITKNNTNRLQILLTLSYSTVFNKVSLEINKQKSSFTIPSDFNGKKIVLWLVEDFSQNITKVKISNYSAILSLPIVHYTNGQSFSFRTEDGVISKMMFSPNFYDTDSEQYHKVMLQEKLNGAYIV